MPPRLFIALDELNSKETETWEKAQTLAESGLPFGFKVNLDYLLNVGAGSVARRIGRMRRGLFADLKMWNGERTMRDTLAMLDGLGVELVTVHAQADTELGKALKGLPRRMKVLATTVLTHYSESYCWQHFDRSRADAVLHFAEVACSAGANGIVLPGTYLSSVKKLGRLTCVPGIRIGGTMKDGRHEDETTPEAAAALGADIVVCGSPIMKDPDPIQAARKILLALGTKLDA